MLADHPVPHIELPSRGLVTTGPTRTGDEVLNAGARLYRLIARHRGQKRALLRLDPVLCGIAHRRADALVAPAAWNAPTPGREASPVPSGLIATEALVLGRGASAHDALAAFLRDAGDGRHILGWNGLYRKHVHVGIGFAASPDAECSGFSFVSGTPETLATIAGNTPRADGGHPPRACSGH